MDGQVTGGSPAEAVPPAGQTWLLTGGAGYIGSHVARALLSAGYGVVVLDDLSTGRAERLPDGVPLVRAHVGDVGAVRAVLGEHGVTGVVHLAAKKAVAESVERPLYYYEQNVAGLIGLLEAMRGEGVRRLVFSSSAAVYGTTGDEPVTEDCPTRPENPYGRTKLIGEWLVRDAVATGAVDAVSLRYFNVVGCAEPALADTEGVNLFPMVLRGIVSGEPVPVFGDDYPTPDGSCVRDYIHVVDLAEAHVAAAALTAEPGCDEVLNIGCGRGSSVLEVLAEFGRAAGGQVAYEMRGRRSGDPASVVADPGRAARRLGWTARLGLAEMVGDAWAGTGLVRGG